MYLVTLVYGGYLIAQGRMDVVDLSMYALYIGIFISPIQILVELMEMMQKGLSGFRRYLDVMEHRDRDPGRAGRKASHRRQGNCHL